MIREPNLQDTQSPQLVIADVSRCPSSIVYMEDCVQGLKRFADKHFDLAIVDPPYGIEDKISKGGGSHTKSNAKFHQMYSENNKKWDVKPTDEYWRELRRVSKNQIVWGGNYFALPECRCFIVWDKVRAVENYSNLEYAWTSFDRHAKMFKYCNNAGFVLKPIDKKIHPTQKPVALYEWILANFAIDDNLILDTHVGSGSSRIACYKGGFNFTGFEIDKDYWEAQEKRYKNFSAQLRLF
jgi:site-specific DNA-methyltransferase (adenine-specific)